MRASALLMLLLIVPALAVAAQDEPQKNAVWKERELDFFYRSSDAIYSCGALEARVASILRAVGARDDLRVEAWDCDRVMVPMDRSHLDPWNNQMRTSRGLNDRYEQNVRVRIRAHVPVAATPEVLAEIEKGKSRRELIARVTGNPLAANEGAVQFPVHWREITLSRKTVGIEAEECELLDEMSRSVLREMGVRVIRRSYTCSGSHIPPKMTVQALVPAPIGPTDVGLPPEDDSEAAQGNADSAE